MMILVVNVEKSSILFNHPVLISQFKILFGGVWLASVSDSNSSGDNQIRWLSFQSSNT